MATIFNLATVLEDRRTQIAAKLRILVSDCFHLAEFDLGFTDAHTYPVWGGDREDDFFQKVAGASYMELSDNVNSSDLDYTVERTANASEDSLYAATLERIRVNISVLMFLLLPFCYFLRELISRLFNNKFGFNLTLHKLEVKKVSHLL